MKSKTNKQALAAIFGLVALASATHGAVIVNNSKNVAPSGSGAYDPATTGTPLLPVSSTDLAQGLTATVTYIGSVESTTSYGAGGTARFTDGSISTVYGGEPSPYAAYGTVWGHGPSKSVVTIDLGSLFDLSKVNVFIGWNDSGRDDASFNLLTSVDGTTYSQISSYSKGVDDTGLYTTPVTNLHSFVDSGASPIASGVRYVQLSFTDSDNGAAGLVEVDVIGTAVPEPSSALLGGLGVLALLRRRRMA